MTSHDFLASNEDSDNLQIPRFGFPSWMGKQIQVHGLSKISTVGDIIYIYICLHVQYTNVDVQHSFISYIIYFTH